MGAHATPRGLWFRPLPWAILAATVSFLLLFLRHVPCIQTDATNPINGYIRVCYNDIQTLFLAHGYGTGTWPIGGESMHFSPLTGVAVMLAILISGLFTTMPAEPELQDQINQSVGFFTVTAVILFVCFVASVVAVWRISQAPGRNWTTFLWGASPVVLAAGLLDWSLLPIALTLVALAQFANRSLLGAGITIGLAASAGTMPIAVTLAVLVACGLRGGGGVALRFGLGAVGTFIAVHLPLGLTNFDAVYRYYHGQIHRETTYGSVWYLLEQLGMTLRHAGSLLFVVTLFLLGCFVAWLFVTRGRPRVGSLVAVFVLATTVLAPGFAPQAALWVMVATLLARPFKLELTGVTVASVGYYLAVWGWIGGALTSGRSGPFGLYWLAILLMAGAQVLVIAESLHDIASPRRDALRSPDAPDPLGGVLNDDEVLAPLNI